MIQEIIYTSAQSGLKSGSSGFCTVVCTAGMDQRTAQRLEGLSGYRHPFGINDPRNPVNFQHLTMRIGSAKTHVLSRICDAGPDHTGRSNKLAHHIAFSQPPSPSGPANCFDAKGPFVSKWDGKTEQRPSPTLASIPVADTNIDAWTSLTGDGGWAGHVAEQLLKSKQPIHILFPPGTSTLPLLTEVLDVIPPARRWEVTFSTYYTIPIAGAECQLRFILDGTKEATRLRNDARAVLIDLNCLSTEAPGGSLTAMARSGYVSHKTAAPERTAELPKQTPAQSTVPEVDEWVEPESDEKTYKLRKPSRVSSRSVTAPPAPTAPNLFGDRRDKERRLAAAGQRSKVPVIVAGVVLLLGVVGGGIWFGLNLSTADDSKFVEQLAAGTKSREDGERVRKAKEQEAKQETIKQDALAKKQREEQDRERREKEIASAAKAKETEQQVVDHKPKPQPEAPPPKQPTDVFGVPLNDDAKPSEPVVRIFRWVDGGVTFPIESDIPLTLTFHHHKVDYEIEENGSSSWIVKGGIGPLKGNVATVQRASGQITVKHADTEKSLPWAVLQINSEDRCGFVLFHQPEFRDPISLHGILETSGTRWTKAIEYPSPEKTATQHVQLKNSDGTTPKQHQITLHEDKSNKQLGNVCAGKTLLEKNIEFVICGGKAGGEYRQVIEITPTRKGSSLSYKLELAEAGHVGSLAPVPPARLESVAQVNLAAKWLIAISNCYERREWETADSDIDADCLKRWEGRKNLVSEVERRLLALYKEKGVASVAKRLPPRATLGREMLNNWQRQKDITNAIKGQAASARAAREEMAKRTIHLAVYLPARPSRFVTIPGHRHKYRLQVPVVEFGDPKSHDTIRWQDLLTKVGSQDKNTTLTAPNGKAPMSGLPQPVSNPAKTKVVK